MKDPDDWWPISLIVGLASLLIMVALTWGSGCTALQTPDGQHWIGV